MGLSRPLAGLSRPVVGVSRLLRVGVRGGVVEDIVTSCRKRRCNGVEGDLGLLGDEGGVALGSKFSLHPACGSGGSDVVPLVRVGLVTGVTEFARWAAVKVFIM